MASQKYFLVTHRVDGVETLVRAPKDSLAVAAVAGDAAGVRQATDDDIATFAGKLHDKSIAPGSGRYFVVGDSIIRAKNAAAAYALVNEDAYEAKHLNQDELVEQLQKGRQPVQYAEPVKPGKSQPAAAPTGEGAPAAVSNLEGAAEQASNDEPGSAQDAGSAVAAVG